MHLYGYSYWFEGVENRAILPLLTLLYETREMAAISSDYSRRSLALLQCLRINGSITESKVLTLRCEGFERRISVNAPNEKAVL
jgi:hypothetical protein